MVFEQPSKGFQMDATLSHMTLQQYVHGHWSQRKFVALTYSC